jgi:hypothetical protein
MRRLEWCETVLIGGIVLCCSILPGRLLAKDSTAVETRIVADYRIDLDNFSLGSFRFTTRLNGSDYRVRGDGHFSLLGGLLYDLRTTAASSGKVTNVGPEPKMYVLSYAGGGTTHVLRCWRRDGTLGCPEEGPRSSRNPSYKGTACGRARSNCRGLFSCSFRRSERRSPGL